MRSRASTVSHPVKPVAFTTTPLMVPALPVGTEPQKGDETAVQSG